MDNWLTVLNDYKVYKKITPIPYGPNGNCEAQARVRQGKAKDSKNV